MTKGFRRTDRAMRALVVPFVVLAGLGAVQLYLFPNDTDRFFAWTLAPPLSATFMGAGFAAGVVLSFLSFKPQPWVVTRTAAVVICTFVFMMTIATFLHLDKMHLQSDHLTARVAAWLWVVVYVVVPPALAIPLVRQWRHQGADPPRFDPMPTALRYALATQGTLMAALGMTVFVAPVELDEIWPWQLTALAGRALAAWLISIGVAGVWAAYEKDLTRTRPAAITFTIAGALWLLGAARGSNDMRWERPSAWVYLVMAAVSIGLGAWGWTLGNRAVKRSAGET